MRRSFQKRLLRCQRDGNLNVADLSRWFDRSYQTVRYWVENDGEPYGTPQDLAHVFRLLDRLEKLIGQRKGFPMPPIAQSRRIEHLLKIRQAVLA